MDNLLLYFCIFQIVFNELFSVVLKKKIDKVRGEREEWRGREREKEKGSGMERKEKERD